MLRRRHWITLSAAALLAVLAGLGAYRVQAAPDQQAPPLKIAIVNWPRLISGLAEWRDNQETLRQRNQKMERVEREMRRRIDVVRTEIKDLAVGTEDRALKEEELDRLQSELRTKMDLFGRQIKRIINTYLEDIYRKVITELDVYAKAKGYDLVIKQQKIELNNARIPVRSQIEMSTVLWSSGRADITDDLIKILDNKYGKQLEVK